MGAMNRIISGIEDLKGKPAMAKPAKKSGGRKEEDAEMEEGEAPKSLGVNIYGAK